MKKIIYSVAAIAAILTLGACNNDYLEQDPIEFQTPETAFVTYKNFETYSWSLYAIFHSGNTNNFTQAILNGHGRYEGDFLAGYLSTYSTTEPNRFRNQTAIAPSSGGGWDYTMLRKINLMTDYIDQSQMTDKEKAHWRSVGYFFHSFNYMELVSRFGDVPWIDRVIKESDTDLIYGAREPRQEVTKKMLERLQYAEKNINSAGDGENTINLHVVRHLMSRFCLFEATWRKYHNIPGGEIFLDEAIRTSRELMKAFPTVNHSYDALLNSEDLSTYDGIILYKEYAKDILQNGVGHTERTSSGKYEMHKATVDMYLCTDGKTIHQSPNYDGDENMYDQFRNRDRRLLMQVVPPFYMSQGVNLNFEPIQAKNPTKYVGQENVAEYADLMKEILPENGAKRLPVFNWSGTMNWMSPNINGPGQAPMGCRSGYYMWRHYNLWDTNSNMASTNTCDKPIFYIEEILLNYAEAMVEKGEFTQGVADETINKLRVRAGVAPMQVSEIDEAFDPKRDKSVDPILWEVRRERMVELMGEGFGFQDIRRWKKGEWFINRTQMGAHVNKEEYRNAKGEIVPAWDKLELVDAEGNKTTEKQGYLKRFDNPTKLGKGWKDQYYLFPLPLKDLSLNSNLVQNPGWN